MNYCSIHEILCPYKLSDQSPLPCFATQDECDKFISFITVVTDDTPIEPVKETKSAVINAISILNINDE